MELVILCGIQGSGKSSFYKARFADTHVRLNLDMLRTRRREEVLLDALVRSKTKFVVDNTNATAADRARYIAPARAAKYRVIVYHLVTPVKAAMARNARRQGRQRVPQAGVLATLQRFEPPAHGEGLDELHEVMAVKGRYGVRQISPKAR